MSKSANDYLNEAIDVIGKRGQEYDQGDGERSMGKKQCRHSTASLVISCSSLRAGCYSRS
jgi:hypothetical protein